MSEASPFSVDPIEAIEFLRKKLNMPTRTWTDVFGAMHDRAFMVAGAQAEDLVEDFHQAVLKGISERARLPRVFRYRHAGRSELYRATRSARLNALALGQSLG